jgi:hypothetical protein
MDAVKQLGFADMESDIRYRLATWFKFTTPSIIFYTTILFSCTGNTSEVCKFFTFEWKENASGSGGF